MKKGNIPAATVRERGVALVAVLWVVILLSVLATALIANFRSDARTVFVQETRQRGLEAAEAGINLALVALSDPQNHFSPNNNKYSFKLDNAVIDVTITAEDGKVDLNAATPELLEGILKVAGTSSGGADQIAAAIISRRNLVSGLERRVPFEAVNELIQISGVSAGDMERLRPNLTVYSGSASIDPNAATPDALLAIPNDTRADAEARIRLRAGDRSSGNMTGDLSRIVTRGFSITAKAALSDQTSVCRTKLVRFTGNPKDPIWILAVE